jgi:hypothetical protein
MPGTAWPEGVIARYLTVGGGIVEVETQFAPGLTAEPIATLTYCTSCPASDEFDHFIQGEWREAWADTRARQWAQAHAEKCRAMPRPTA